MSLKAEVKRKTLHLSGLLIPLFYFYFGIELTLIFVSMALIVFFMIEPYRISQNRSKNLLKSVKPFLAKEVYSFLNERVEKINERLLEISREEERICIGAHIYFAIASLITIILFPKYIAIGAISVATVGDAMAALIGKRFGKHRFKNGKSWEGSGAFFISALLIFLLVLPYGYSRELVILGAIVGAMVGTLVEFFDVPPNDNFSNQIFISLSIYLLAFLL